MKKKMLVLSVLMNMVLIVSLVLVGTGMHKTILNKLSLNASSEHNPRYMTRDSIFESKEISNSDVVFLGDSLTENNEWSEAFPEKDVYNRGIYGDGTQGVLDRIEQIKDSDDTKVFLLIGINDLANGLTKEEVAENFSEISSQLKDKELYFQSLLPLDGEAYPNVKDEDIVWLNTYIEEASKKEGYEYVDLYSIFSDGNGSLSEKWSYDGLHLNGEAYEVWEEQVRTYIEA